MIKEYVKGALAVIIIGGAVYSAFVVTDASEKLIPLASFVLGYYFKDVAGPVATGIKNLFLDK